MPHAAQLGDLDYWAPCMWLSGFWLGAQRPWVPVCQSQGRHEPSGSWAKRLSSGASQFRQSSELEHLRLPASANLWLAASPDSSSLLCGGIHRWPSQQDLGFVLSHQRGAPFRGEDVILASFSFLVVSDESNFMVQLQGIIRLSHSVKQLGAVDYKEGWVLSRGAGHY